MLLAQRGSGAYNGFDLSNATIPRSQILSGGPPRDGIPSLDNPRFVDAEAVDFLRDNDRVVGLERDGEARAYPLRIVVWHEIVNDDFGGQALAITYCPLCGTCMVFDRKQAAKTLTFGVSGLLYQSDVLMYDRETESLWSQLKMEAVSGTLVGTKLNWLPSSEMTWKAWRDLHPETKVLSIDTGHTRRYASDAYRSYKNSPNTVFPVPRTRRELKPKEWVVALIVNDVPKAYSVTKLEAMGGHVTDTVGGARIDVSYDRSKRWATATLEETGEAIPVVNVYWFAWQAFYPSTEFYSD